MGFEVIYVKHMLTQGYPSHNKYPDLFTSRAFDRTIKPRVGN